MGLSFTRTQQLHDVEIHYQQFQISMTSITTHILEKDKQIISN
jgi:hypothetical protein